MEDDRRLPERTLCSFSEVEGDLLGDFLLGDVEDNLRLPEEGELDEELPSEAGEVDSQKTLLLPVFEL